MSGSQHTANAAHRMTVLAVALTSASIRNGQKRPADKEQDKGLAHVFDDFANLFHSYSSFAMPPPYRKAGAGQELFFKEVLAHRPGKRLEKRQDAKERQASKGGHNN